MKLTKKMRYLLVFSAIQAVSLLNAEECDTCPAQEPCDNIGKNLFMPRPFSSYATGDLITLRDLNLEDDWGHVFGATAEYMQSFGDSQARVGSLPFWSGTNTMTIGTNDGESDVDGYQFGLGEVTTPGSITLNPKIQHTGVNFLWHVLQHPIHEHGMYFQFKAPLGAMMIDARLCEDAAGLANEPDENFARYTANALRFKTVTDALYGGYPNREPDLKYGRVYSCRQSVIRMGDLEAVLGYNFLAGEKGYLGAGFKVSMPTGNVPTAEFMLEPLFGRAGHWGVGGEIRGSRLVYDGEEYQVTVQGKGEVLHLFSGRRPSMRSFDLLANGKGSKYMLVQLYLENDINGTSASHITPAINITTLPVLSTFAVEGNAAFMLDVTKDCWNMGLIAEFWGRSKECLKIDCCEALAKGDLNLNSYAVLGRQVDKYVVPGTSPTTVTMNLCEPEANINKSVDRVAPTGSPLAPPSPLPAGVADATQATNRIPSGFDEALDIAGAAQRRVFTGRITGELGYTFKDNKHEPHLGIIGGAEFTGSSSKMINLWSVGLQGSAKF